MIDLTPKIPRTEESLCIGCGVCLAICPVKGLLRLSREEIIPGVEIWKVGMPPDSEAITLETGESLPQYCIKCRRCVEECPSGAKYFPS